MSSPFLCVIWIRNRQKHVWGEISPLSAVWSQLCTHWCGTCVSKADDRPSVGAFSFLPSFPHISVSSLVKWVGWTCWSPRSFQFCWSVEYEKKRFKGLQNSINSIWTNTAPRVYTQQLPLLLAFTLLCLPFFLFLRLPRISHELGNGSGEEKGERWPETEGWDVRLGEGPQQAWAWPWQGHVVVGMVTFGAATPNSLRGMWPQQD